MDARNVQRVDPVLDQSARDYQLALVRLIAQKDTATYHHSNRVAAITEEWCEYQKNRNEWLEVDQETLVSAARLHDLGKIGVLDEILNQVGPLSDSQRSQLKLHPEIGYELVRDLKNSDEIALAIRHHHERWDGGGYPLGLKESQIPFFAQVISIVDAFDAMTSTRSYQKTKDLHAAAEDIRQNAGRQFAPHLAFAFVQFLHARNT